jgi:hypothetical protein
MIRQAVVVLNPPETKAEQSKTLAASSEKKTPVTEPSEKAAAAPKPIGPQTALLFDEQQ